MSKKMVVLKSSDGISFEIEETVAVYSKTIGHMVEDDCAENGIPLENVTGKILEMVIEYCKKHVDPESSSSDESKKLLKKWDAAFMKIEASVVFEVMMAANYLSIQSLVDLTCQTVADMIPGKTPAELRTLFNIKNDLTQEEEAKILRANKWAFE